MSRFRILRIIVAAACVSVYAAMPQHAPRRAERGPMQRKAVVRVPRQGVGPAACGH